MSDIQITIRRMTKEDATKVANIESQVFSEPWPYDEFVKATLDEKYIYLVATCEDEVVGYAGCFVVCEDSDVTNIAVDAEYRRLGIADVLIDTLSKEAKKKGAEHLFLEVRESNEGARCLYKKNDFVEVGKRKDFYRKPTETAILMERDLKGLV